MKTMQSTRAGDAESPSTAIPKMAVPAAPIPVQTAYPVPTGSVRSASERRKTLDKPVAAVNSAGYQPRETCGPLHAEGESDFEKAGGGQYYPCHVGQIHSLVAGRYGRAGW